MSIVHASWSMADVSLAAFIGSVEQSLPHFVGDGGVCQQLTGILGEMNDSGNRWRDMLTSGCKTGVEFATAWNTLRQEAMEANQYLDKELEGPLEVDVECAGDGRVGRHAQLYHLCFVLFQMSH